MTAPGGRHTVRAGVAVGVLWLLAGAPARTQLGNSQLAEILIAEPTELGPRLNTLARQGFRVGAVAIPEAPLIPAHAIVVLTRADTAAPPDYRVVGDSRLSKVMEDVNALAAQGYVLKGLTLTAGRVFQTPFSFEAVLERGAATDSSRREYRFVRTLGTAATWKQLEQAGREGFDVIDVISRPDPLQSAAGDVTFVCEKRADGAPVTFELKWHGDVTRVERDVNELAAKGYALRALWPGTTSLSALLARWPGATATTAPAYEIDADPITVPSVSSMSGRLVAWMRFRGEQVAAFDRAGKGQYEMVTDPVPDEDRVRRPLVEQARDRIERHVRRGYRAIWARYFRDEKGVLTLSVILEATARTK
jgi:hypothetical protein